MINDKSQNTKHFKISGIEALYTLFLALLAALVFGLGVSAFYESPKMPEYPTVLNISTKDAAMTKEQTNAQISYDKSMKNYQTEVSTYTRNVSMVTLGLAVIALVVSLIFLDNIYVISNGLLLGGVFTLIYSMIRGFMTDDTKYRFVIALIGLIIALVIGYIKFIKPNRQNN